MANMDTGKSLANGNKRNNRAKAQVDGRFVSEFNAGQAMANDRQHPTDGHKKGQHHTTDDGVRV
jgi:hypothetical protein